jgi:effector-binding domain-containing protein
LFYYRITGVGLSQQRKVINGQSGFFVGGSQCVEKGQARMTDTPIVYKKLEPIQVAFIMTRIDTREQILPLFKRLQAACGEAISGHAMVIFHGGAVKDGFLIEAAFPVKLPVETGEVHTRLVEAAPAITMKHYGEHKTIRESVLKIYDYINKHAWSTSLSRREIYLVLNGAEPEKNITEVQAVLHEWDRLLAEGAEKVLGEHARDYLLVGIETITPSSSFDEYSAWIQGAIERLDALTSNEEQKCQVVSHCAHVFPQQRIEHLRAIYEQGNFDEILHEMYDDDFWYEKPVRRGNVIYMRKNPFDPEGYTSATTPAGQRKAYCHCPFVRPYLEENFMQQKVALSPTFCYCGAGWYRRLWEGVLGQPVKIEHVETLLKGNDQCTLEITLPLDLVGECTPRHFSLNS